MSWAVKRMQSMAHGRIREMGRIYVSFAVYGSRYRAVTEPRGGGCDAVSHGCYMDWFVTTSCAHHCVGVLVGSSHNRTLTTSVESRG